MDYKQKIDAIRYSQSYIVEILDQICDDIRRGDPNLSELLNEHHIYINLFAEKEKLIYDLQPWYRRLTGWHY